MAMVRVLGESSAPDIYSWDICGMRYRARTSVLVSDLDLIGGIT
jgi:hypothetical protein